MNGVLPKLTAPAMVFAAAMLFASPAAAQGDTTNTRAGVFTTEQAAKGRELHGFSCLSCHKPVEHTGPKFWNEIVGKPISEFFGYIRSNMPQDNPRSLADDDYASIIAFILQLNSMPAGEKPLPGDSTALAKIRVSPLDSTRKGLGK